MVKSTCINKEENVTSPATLIYLRHRLRHSESRSCNRTWRLETCYQWTSCPMEMVRTLTSLQKAVAPRLSSIDRTVCAVIFLRRCAYALHLLSFKTGHYAIDFKRICFKLTNNATF